jgi:hypothetical protein
LSEVEIMISFDRSIGTSNVDVTGPRLRGSGGQQGSASSED